MEILHLPNDLKIDTENEIQVFDYQARNSSIKNKVMFNKNIFSFLLEGTKEIFTQNKMATINNDSFLLIKSKNCLMTENLSENNTYRSILLFFDNDMLLNFLQKNNLPTKDNLNPKPFETFKYDDYIQDFVKSLIKIKNYADSLQKSLLQTKLEEILNYLIHKNGTQFLNNIVAYQDNQTKHFTTVIESNKLNNLTLQELSFLCNMSISTFKRNFEQHYQTSPIKWFLEKRLEYSAYLLSNKKQRPIDIYLEVGFESLSSFTQAFKAKYNTTPKQFQLSK